MQTIVDFRQGQYGCHAPGVRGGNAFYATFFTATSLGYVSDLNDVLWKTGWK